MKYHFKVHKEGSGFWAECIELDGCYTQGDSKEELFENMQDALNTYLHEPADSKTLAALPRASIKTTQTVVEVPVDPSVALAYSIRRQRIKNGLTQEEVAKELKMKNIYSYQRLEKKCNPTLEILVKLLNIFPSLSVDKALK